MNNFIKITFSIKISQSLFEYAGTPLYKRVNALDAGGCRIYWPGLPALDKHPCQYILQTRASLELSLLYSRLPTYSNNVKHILIKNFIFMNVFVLFHPSTRYSPNTNLGLLPKPAGRPSHSVFFSCIYGRDPDVRSKCSIAVLAGNVLIPCLLASQLAAFV